MSARDPIHARGRLAPSGLLIVILILAGLGPRLLRDDDPLPASSSHERRSEMPEQIREALAAIDLAMPEGSNDLAMGWGDLRSDLESISRDLDSRPADFDAGAIVDRVTGFQQRFASEPAVIATQSVWHELIGILGGINSSLDE